MLTHTKKKHTTGHIKSLEPNFKKSCLLARPNIGYPCIQTPMTIVISTINQSEIGVMFANLAILVGGLEHVLCSHILVIIIPFDSYFSDGWLHDRPVFKCSHEKQPDFVAKYVAAFSDTPSHRCGAHICSAVALVAA